MLGVKIFIRNRGNCLWPGARGLANGSRRLEAFSGQMLGGLPLSIAPNPHLKSSQFVTLSRPSPPVTNLDRGTQKQVQSLSKQVDSLAEQLQIPNPSNSSLRLASSILKVNPLVNQLGDEIVRREDFRDTNGICENSFLLSNAKQLSHACPNSVGDAAA